jgi:tetratricopeptide (TPR) repeat protein
MEKGSLMGTTIEQNLKTAFLQNHRMIFFIGSGLSSNYPTWKKFLYDLISKCKSETDNLESIPLNKSESLENLQKKVNIYHELFPNAIHDYMREYFKPESENVPRIFDILVRIPCAFYITTNYDTNIEDSFKRIRGKELPVVLPDNPENALRNIASNTVFLFKLHGCALKGGPYVISQDDYKKIARNKKIMIFLGAIFACHEIIFLGYGQNDHYIQDYMRKQHQALVKGSNLYYQFILNKPPLDETSKNLFSGLGIRSIKIKNWNAIENILEQISFLQVRDHYAETRRRFREDFVRCIKDYQNNFVWGTILYTFASSDLGMGKDCESFISAVKEPFPLDKAIKQNITYNLVFNVIAGQFYKRNNQSDKAKKYFRKIEKIINHDKTIIAPLRSMGLRYAGIFWFEFSSAPEVPSEKRDKYFKRSDQLIKSASRVLGDNFPEEKLDVKKWLALLLGKTNHEKAIKKLKEIADEATKKNYDKNAAWSYYGAAKLMKNYGQEKSEDFKDLIAKAINIFERLEHFRGLSSCYYLKALSVDSPDKKRELIDYAHALAKFVGDERLVSACESYKKKCFEQLEKTG